jgi:hypothetical protein
MHQAFELTEDFSELSGGSFAGPNGETILLLDLLAEGPTVVRTPEGVDDFDLGDTGPEGVVVVSNDYVRSVLAGHPAFRDASVPDGYVLAGDELPPSEDLAKLTKSDLTGLARKADHVDAWDESWTKAKMLHALRPTDFPDPDSDGPAGQTDLNPDGSPAVADDEQGE